MLLDLTGTGVCKMNVTFNDWFGEKKTAKVVGVFSDKFEDGKMDGKEIFYWAKKCKDYRKVKDKDLGSVYFELETPRGKTEFALLEDIISTK